MSPMDPHEPLELELREQIEQLTAEVTTLREALDSKQRAIDELIAEWSDTQQQWRALEVKLNGDLAALRQAQARLTEERDRANDFREILKQVVTMPMDEQMTALSRALSDCRRQTTVLTHERDEARKWKAAINEAGIVHWTLTDETATDPLKAVNTLICMAAEQALDPAISGQAHKLVERAESAERQLAEKAEECAEERYCTERTRKQLVKAERQIAAVRQWATSPSSGWREDNFGDKAKADVLALLPPACQGDCVLRTPNCRADCTGAGLLSREPTACLDCGMPYADFPLDMTFSRSQWLDIHPDDGGLLCANCMVRRASKLPRACAVRAVVEIMPTFEPTPAAETTK